MAGGGEDLWALADLRTPWCLRVVVSLGAVDAMADGDEDVSTLAARLGCDRAALDAVLGHLAACGLFAETGRGRYAVTERGRALRDPALRVGLDLTGIGGRMAAVWSTLPEYVRTGRSAYAERFGRTFWQDLEADPALGESFDALMGPLGHGPPDASFEPDGGGRPAARLVVDVGGGTGALLAEILRRHAHLRGVLVDLGRTAARASETFAAAGVSERARVAAQRFFDPLPPGGDIYLLHKVLSNWPDAEAGAILGRCAEALAPQGRVLVVGGVAPDGARPEIAEDVLLTGGRTRPLAEFRALAAAHGLEVREARDQGRRFVVECLRAVGAP